MHFHFLSILALSAPVIAYYETNSTGSAWYGLVASHANDPRVHQQIFRYTKWGTVSLDGDDIVLGRLVDGALELKDRDAYLVVKDGKVVVSDERQTGWSALKMTDDHWDLEYDNSRPFSACVDDMHDRELLWGNADTTCNKTTLAFVLLYAEPASTSNGKPSAPAINISGTGNGTTAATQTNSPVLATNGASVLGVGVLMWLVAALSSMV